MVQSGSASPEPLASPGVPAATEAASSAGTVQGDVATAGSGPRLLVVTPDVVGARMAGPGMRYVAIARSLAPFMPVTFAVGIAGSTGVDFGALPVTVAPFEHRADLERLVDDCDVVFCQFIDTNVVRYALRQGKRVIYDLYNALPIETVGAEIISGFDGVVDKDREFSELLRYFRFVSRTGSYFVTSNERQRDWWLGYIMASGGVLPSTLEGRTAADIVGLAPFGMEEADPVQSRRALRGSHGITDEDFVLIWAGGIWDWFDAETPIRAVAELAKTNPDIKLVFYGTVHPNASIGKPKAVGRAEEVARSLGVLGSNVIFLDEWVPAAERADYLLDADVALSAHKESLETHYAFRTRILDHFWATLPSIVSAGDWFADYIDANELGTVVPTNDLDAMITAIGALHSDADLRAAYATNIRAAREDWRWSSTTEPLRRALTTDLASLAFVPEPESDDPTPPAVAPAPPVSTKQLARSLAGRVVRKAGLGGLADTLRR